MAPPVAPRLRKGSALPTLPRDCALLAHFPALLVGRHGAGRVLDDLDDALDQLSHRRDDSVDGRFSRQDTYRFMRQAVEYRLLWLDYYSELEPVAATDKLRGMSGIAALGAQKGETPLAENETTRVGNVIPLGATRRARKSRRVREMP